MKIIIAPDSFKECLTAPKVAVAIAEGLRMAAADADIITMPIADGGEGTLDILVPALGAQILSAEVSDPLGRPITARYGLIPEWKMPDGDGPTAIIEIAQACGLSLLSKSERNPLIASTFGLGQLLTAASDAECRQFIIGLGGSGTCDGGSGMLSVPGVKTILKESEIELLCDVDAPFTGPCGAAMVFGPQKGAAGKDLQILEDRMQAFVIQMFKETERDISAQPGAGAAGGLGGAFMAYSNARISSGIDRLLDLVGFDDAIRDADIVITGEGRSDMQTLAGKVPLGVLHRARAASNKEVKVILISGVIDPAAAGPLKDAGFSTLISATPPEMPLEEALKPETAARNLKTAAAGYLGC